MEILFYQRNRFIRDELREFLDELAGRPHFAETIDAAITILNTRPIDAAFIEIQDFTDIGLLKYINQYHLSLKTVLVVENEFEKAISVIRKGDYGLLKCPFGLRDIKDYLTQEIL